MAEATGLLITRTGVTEEGEDVRVLGSALDMSLSTLGKSCVDAGL